MDEIIDDLLEVHAKFLRDGQLSAKEDIRRLRNALLAFELDAEGLTEELKECRENLEECQENLDDTKKVLNNLRKNLKASSETEEDEAAVRAEIYSQSKHTIQGEVIEVKGDEIEPEIVLRLKYNPYTISFKTTKDLAKVAGKSLYQLIEAELTFDVLHSITTPRGGRPVRRLCAQKEPSVQNEAPEVIPWVEDIEAQLT